MNIQTIQLDVTKAPSTLPVVRLRQGDKNGTTLRAEMYDDGEELALAGYDVKFCMRVPDDWGYYEVSGYATGNVATFLIDETYAAGTSGKTDTAYVEVLDGESVIYSTGNICVIVLPSATEGRQAGTYTNGVERFIEESEQRVDDAIAAIGEISELAVPLMSADVRGGAKLGSGLEIVDGYLNATGGSEYELPTMSASTKGGAKLGSGLAVANDRLSLQGEVFTQAEKSKLAGIDPGANAYELPPATTSTLGGVKPDGTTVTVDADGTIHGASSYDLPTMSSAVKGGAKLGSGLAVANDMLSVDASTVANGVLPVAQGGTGATTESVSRTRFGSVPLGRCPSSPSSPNKVVDNTGFNNTTNQPYAGARIAVKFANYANNAELCTIDTGNAQYQIWINGAATSASNPLIITEGAIAEFIFDGTQWHYLGNNIDGYQDYDANQAIADNAAAIDTLRESVFLTDLTKKVIFHHWATGLQIDFEDASENGFALVADMNEISLYKITAGTFAKQKRIAWT